MGQVEMEEESDDAPSEGKEVVKFWETNAEAKVLAMPL